MLKATVLWVSDAPRNSVTAQLESIGYAVLSARVREALAVLFVNRSIDVVLLSAGDSPSDSLMLARGLRAIRPEIPILLVTTAPDTQVSSIKDCLVVGEDLDQIIPQLNAAMLRLAI